MRVGEVLGGRFELVGIAGRGGMGTVYRAADREAGGPVAVKILGRTGGDAALRFANEARTLAELDHPQIVRYILHGTTPEGEPYLVMEWLEGESLEDRLAQGRLGLQESVDLLRSVATALCAAHARGVVHRDVKPSNIFLPSGGAGTAKLVDFGIARLGDGATLLTPFGGVVGTPGYMAPEQARGETESVDARADVFSLGAVLFECLTGRPAFQGAHVVALLAKVLWEEAPRVREISPEVPAPLDTLVARMLAKSPSDRPANGTEVIASLDRLSEEDVAPAAPPPPPGSVTATEKRLVSVVAILHPAAVPARSEAATLLENNLSARLLPTVQAAVAPFGARVDALANGMLVVLLVGAGTAMDLAALSARSALRLQALLPEARLVLVTGWEGAAERSSLGKVLERAGALLAQTGERGGDDGARYRPIHIDGVTRALLDARFDVAEEHGHVVLRGEKDFGESARRLLGKPSPFVGRDREMRGLMDLVEDTFSEGKSRVVLVTAEAGMGKSRLRHELLQRVRALRSDVILGAGRGDAMSAGSAFGMIASALRGAMQIAAGEPIEEQRRKLSFTVDIVVQEPERRRVTELLGELIGTPFPAESSERLRAARRNASIMADQTQAAFIDFMRALARRRPTLILFEDLHWGDAPSVKLVDVALRELEELPFVVVAFARPAVHDVFPRLWRGRGLHEIHLGALSRRAGVELVRSALGEEEDEATVLAVVDRAGGNPFYLEEMIRAVAEGRRDGLPETILGMVEARLSTLSPGARRTLRGASVFGDVFWERGVLTLLGDPGETGGAGHLSTLIDQELLVPIAASRLAGEEQYAFRHTLIREVAYAMLPDRDRTLSHRRAAEWLEQAGEEDPMTLAAHFELGGQRTRAGEHYVRAAELAHRAGDTTASMDRARRGLACGVPAELNIHLLGLLSEIHMWRNEWALAASFGEEVIGLAGPGSTPWVRAVTARLVDAMNRGEVAEALSLLHAVHTADLSLDAVEAAALALALGVVFLVTMGRADLAARELRRLHALVEPVQESQPMARAWMHLGHPRLEAWIHEDPHAGLRHGELALVAFREAHYERGVGFSRVFIGMSAWMLGDHEAAEVALRQEVSSDAEFAPVASLHTLLLTFALNARGKTEEALVLARRLIGSGQATGAAAEQARGHWALAEALRVAGDLRPAEDEAQLAVRAMSGLPLDRAAALATLAAIQLQAGRPARALETVRLSLALSEDMGAPGYLGASARLTHAECLHATGDHTSAREAIGEARDRLLRNAAKIGDARLRRLFLDAVPENRRTLALAGQWASQALHADTDEPALVDS